jgi:hypothetical protein
MTVTAMTARISHPQPVTRQKMTGRIPTTTIPAAKAIQTWPRRGKETLTHPTRFENAWLSNK